jgi:vacuolar protein sorting-associated protein 13D
MLQLFVHVMADLGGSLKLRVGAPYWLVNRAGIPLVFRQDGGQVAAGQFDDHEMARSVSPLLFCYAEKDGKEKCSMRLGTKWVNDSEGKPLWCHRFSLERGCGVRPLHVKYYENRPDKVFNVGIDVRQGRGRYCDTNIVTFSPRYQLDNRSSQKLFFAQRHLISRGAVSHCYNFLLVSNSGTKKKELKAL